MSQYTAKQILAFTRYSDLFTKDPKKELKVLQHYWHPDRNKDPLANDVFAHIMLLYHMTNTPVKVSDVAYVNMNGENCTFRYFTSETLSFGKAYYTNGAVCYVFDQDNEFLIDHFKKNLSSIEKHINANFKDKYAFAIPSIYEIKSPTNILILKLTKDLVPLSLVYKYYNQKLNPCMAAWIISRMFDFSMMLHVNQMVGNGFSMSTCFVHLKDHRMTDLTSFFYATPISGKLHALNADAIDFYPHDCLTKKQADPKCDVALIKRLGIQLLGDPSGVGNILSKDPEIPEPILKFLQSTGSNQKHQHYIDWQHKVLVDAYGKRKFFKSEVDTALLLNQ